MNNEILEAQNELLSKLLHFLDASQGNWDVIVQTTIGGILASITGAVAAYFLSRRNARLSSSRERYYELKRIIIENASRYEELSTEYWSRPRVEDKDSQSEILMKIVFAQLRRYLRFLYKQKISEEIVKEIDDTVDRLFDYSQGGEFESKAKNTSRDRAKKSQIFCGKIISSVHSCPCTY